MFFVLFQGSIVSTSSRGVKTPKILQILKLKKIFNFSMNFEEIIFKNSKR